MHDTQHKPLILLVDDTPENLDVLRGILTPRYRISAATSGELALRIIAKNRPDLILLDVMMPGMDGYQVCRQLKAHAETASIPVIFATAMTELDDEMRGFDAGAVDYITKPVHPGIVHARVAAQLALANQRRACETEVERRTGELSKSQKAAIFMLGQAGHYNDTDTGVHIWRMAAYSAALARALDWPLERSELLRDAAAMHDTGKIGTPDSILKAPRRLTAEEWEIMKQHARIGYSILRHSDTPLFRMAAEVALGHHEKWDGSGYPQGLAGEAIPASARVVAIADVFDALSMRRPYKPAWPLEQTLQTLQADAGKHFDPQMLNAFLGIIDEILEIKQKWDAKETQGH
ncbi:MAG: response regulator [Gammaproteobacteria bacterium SHHR-1]|uniref:response regulator n=1 Tax=Magnetovirga frankeli TaxID=947516 RepID=UPI001292FC41|nr:response regulator [gamma proteobacterium SS-5]